METRFNPSGVVKPEQRMTPEGESVYDFKAYFHELAKKTRAIRKGDPEKGIPPDPEGAKQYLEQEKNRVGWKVACELRQREEDKARELHQESHFQHLVDRYEHYLKNESGIIGKETFEENENIPEPDYDVLDESPEYPYEADLGLSPEQKKDMMKKVVDYLRERNIFVQFSRTINDVTANDTKGGYIKLNPDGSRNLPIGELMGNKIILNPWNVDFMSTFMTIGHLYGHVVQETTLAEYAGIRKFLAYPKPLDMNVVQADYKQEFGGNDYKADFKVFEEEAFSYAKYTFQQAGIEWTDKLEYAMRTYIETDYDELWDWATKEPEKSAERFMHRFQRYYTGRSPKQYAPLRAKEVNIRVVPDPNGNVKVVRDGEL